MIGFGSAEISKAYLGGTEINKMYLGDELVFGGEDSSITILENVGLHCVSAYIELPDIGLSNVGLSIDGKYNVTTNNTYMAMLGHWYNNQNVFRLLIYSREFRVQHLNTYINSNVASDTLRHTFELRNGNFIIDNNIVNTYNFNIPTKVTTNNINYYINISSYHSRTVEATHDCTIYGIRLYDDDGTLISDYRPAYSANEDKYLFYDIVRKYKLYPVSGTLEIDE